MMLRLMTLQSTDPTLYALFCLRRQTLPVHTGTLARLTGRSASQIALDLLQLESLGLVSAADARLTMLGLARGAQLARASGDVAVPEVKRKAPRLKPPVAADAQVDDGEPEALSA